VELTALSKSHGKVVCPHASTIASVLHFVFIRSYKALERAKRCVNTGGDDCANGYFPDAGNDGGYFGGGSTPGKRTTLGTLSPTDIRKALLRCVNTGGDDCANGYFPDAGNDGGYFGGGSTPGKRSPLQFNAKPLCLLFPMSSACRNE